MQTDSKTESEPQVRCDDRLGVNRLGDTILCYAWGETERPNVMLARTKEEVRRFIVLEWIDDDKDPMVQEIMDELAAHDWREDGELTYEFEIGGCRFVDVVSVIEVKRLVDKFLAWPLPDSVSSDPCVCDRGHPARSGTNLLTATEAKEMFEHVLRDA